MAWSLAVLDQGISNWFERTYRQNIYEYDFYDRNSETDYGVDKTHGTYVAMTARSVQPALGFIDLRIMDSSGYLYTSTAESALSKVVTLSKQGYGIGALNLSWGLNTYPWDIVDELTELGSRGIFAIAASGNNGSAASLEASMYPAALSNVISVGSHDGAGNPSPWSQNQPGSITVLADGQDMPEPGVFGTSFATPQVAAGVASLQAYATYGIGRTLTLAEMKDALQQGGRAPLSNTDPADGKSRYYLYDYNGVVDYFRGKYLQPNFDPIAYIASYSDLTAAYGANAQAGLSHFLDSGAFEGRTVNFNGWSYLAANPDLVAGFGANTSAGASHYVVFGRQEGRSKDFDAASYLAANPDLIAPFGNGITAAARHYVQNGINEGRSTTFDSYIYIASYTDLISAYGANAALGVQHYISSGYREGRRLEFDGKAYLAANPDLARVFGNDTNRAAKHYIEYGLREGRATGPEPTQVSEGTTDFPGTTATTGRMTVGGQVTGKFSTSAGYVYSGNDVDWYAINLRAGQSIDFTVSAKPTSSYSLGGPYLSLYDSRGVIVKSGSTNFTSHSANLNYTPIKNEKFYVEVSAYVYGSSWVASALPQPYTITATERRAGGMVAEAADMGMLAIGA